MDRPTYDNINPEGFVIVPDALDLEKCSKLKDSLIKNTIDLIFTQNGFQVDPRDPEVTKLFVDMKLREQKLGVEGKKIVWRNGNSRQPLISKSCGMTHIHFNQEMMEEVAFNPKIYNITKIVVGTPYLVHCDGPERFCIKPKGSTDMPQHIDSNLFDDSVNYKFRIQSLITLEIDTDINPRDSGTLCLLVYFHHYWNFARELFHPKTGLEECRFPNLKSRFFTLPKDFDKKYLPLLKKHIKGYEKYLSGEKPENDFYISLKEKGIEIPDSKLRYADKMNWKPIPLKPGEMVFWSQYLPHFSVRNKSDTPRICVYSSYYPVNKDWFGSKHQKWVSKQFTEGKFFCGKDSGVFPETIINIEEYKYLASQPGRIQEIAKSSQKNDFRLKITGQKDYF